MGEIEQSTLCKRSHPINVLSFWPPIHHPMKTEQGDCNGFLPTEDVYLRTSMVGTNKF